MDKENLYYVVLEGTNDRVPTLDGKGVLIAIKAAAEEQARLCAGITYHQRRYAAISIKDYEEQFTEQKPKEEVK